MVEGYLSNNLGDDLFFSLLTKRYLGTQFTFSSDNKSQILNSFSNVVIGHQKLKNVITNVRNFDLFILVGGSMFQQIKGQPWFKRWFILFVEVLLFKICKKDIIFIGFNFGPYQSKSFKVFYRFLFNFVDYLSVRDKKTFELFHRNSKVHLFPDIVFSLPNDLLNSSKQKSLAISVMDFGPNVDFQQTYEDSLVKVINRVDPTMEITLYGFQVSSDIDDSTVINRIKKKIERPVKSLCYDGTNMDLFLKDYSKNFFAITSRFHSLVLSLKAKQQVISVDYNIKVGALLSTLNIKNLNVKIDDLTNSEIISEIIKSINYAELKDNSYLGSKELKEITNQSTKHFTYLDKILGIKNEKNNI